MVETEPQEADEPQEAPQEEPQEAKKGDITVNITKGILTFTYRNNTYVVPVKELKSYIVADEQEQEQE